MCTRIRCSSCGKPTWTGCGAHVEQVMRGVAMEDRCKCREERAQRRAANPPGGLFRRLFSKG